MATSKSTVLGLRLDHDRRAWVEAAAAEQGVTVRVLFEGMIDQARTGETPSDTSTESPAAPAPVGDEADLAADVLAGPGVNTDDREERGESREQLPRPSEPSPRRPSLCPDLARVAGIPGEVIHTGFSLVRWGCEDLHGTGRSVPAFVVEPDVLAATSGEAAGARTPPVRAGTRALWVLLTAAVLVAACSWALSDSTRSGAAPPTRSWPTRAQATACAKNSPGTWMRCLVKARPAFADVPLSSLAIPGAENAGTFNLDPQAFDTQPGSACTTLSSGNGAGGAKAQHFSTTQDQTVTTQLDDGIRWIDLHVGYNGGGNAVTGWRVVQNLYSSWPLSEYLDQVANWAANHPTEAVVVDLSTICYDHSPTAAIDQGLWANFATKSAEGAGPKTIADVAARPSSFGGSLASATLRDLARRGHNVVVLIPAFAVGWRALPGTYHVNPVRTTVPGRGGSGTTTVMRSDPKVAPTSPSPVSAGQRRTRRLPDQVQAAARVTPRSGPVRQQVGLRARRRLRRSAEDDPLLVRRPHRLPRDLPRLDVGPVERGLRADPQSGGVTQPTSSWRTASTSAGSLRQ